jgi:sigma-B regulation protein RsbU (phosphoserine phosphatase)
VRPARVLVVDDEPGMLRAVERILSRRHQVTGTPSSKEALEIAATLKPDLAILDVRMPELDGFELTARLKRLDPFIDVILMTGSMSNPDAKLIRAVRENAFYFIQKPFDAEVLRTLVERCLDLRRLADLNRLHTARLEGELAEAQLFQRSLLPEPSAVYEGIAIDCRYAPCSELGGDFCDYAHTGRGRASFLVADVSGHGVSAAMLTGIVKAAFRSCHVEDYDPLAVIERIRTGLQPFRADRFVTVFAGCIDVKERRLRYVNAGHPEALLWGPGRNGIVPLDSTGPLISPAFSGFLWEMKTLDLAPGDRLLLYTDGIPEARGPEGFFSDERIRDAVVREPAGGAPLLDALLKEVDSWSGSKPQPDDLTLLTARLLD